MQGLLDKMEHLCESIPESMSKLLLDAAKEVRKAKRIAAFSHIDTDGISALAIISLMLEREGKLFGYEIKLNKNKVKAPAAWRTSYPAASFEVINRENYISFIS